jgi:hypothetical protein
LSDLGAISIRRLLRQILVKLNQATVSLVLIRYKTYCQLRHPKGRITLAPINQTLKIYPTRSGTRFMPGATWTSEGVNFSMFSKNAQKVELLLYQAVDSAEPLQIVQLDPNTNRTYFYWHVLVVGLRPGAFYTWRIVNWPLTIQAVRVIP